MFFLFLIIVLLVALAILFLIGYFVYFYLKRQSGEEQLDSKMREKDSKNY